MATSTAYPLHRPELLDALRRGDAALQQAMDAPRRRRASEALITVGEASQIIYRLQSGWAIRCRHLPDGRRQISAVFLPGDLMGVKSMLLERQPDGIKCLTDVIVQTIDQEKLRQLVATNPDAGLRVMFQFAEDERRLHNWMAALGRGSADERIATFMLDLRGRLSWIGFGKDGDGATPTTFNLPMTQQEIGDHLGITIVHVNRTLRRLREIGAITVKGRVARIDDVGTLVGLAAPLQDIFERATPAFGGVADGADGIAR